MMMLLLFSMRIAAASEVDWAHTPMRPALPVSKRPLEAGPAVYVDAARGSDDAAGSEQAPFKSIARAMKQLQPGSAVVLRGGVYYESVNWTVSGKEGSPVTLRAYPGELVTIDAGLREFFDQPQVAWEPAAGTPGLYHSTKVYPDISKNAGRGVGNCGDSMVPLHPNKFAVDLKTDNPYYSVKDRHDQTQGVYCGPGVYFDRDGATATNRFLIRLAPTKLSGLGSDNYTGEADPRKLHLVIAGGQHALNLEGVSHVRVQDITFRGARAATISLSNATDVELDGVTSFAGENAIAMENCTDIRIHDSAFRGLSAPWSFRNHQKYRGIDSYLLITGPKYATPATNQRIDVGYCEFTDHHDALRIDGAKSIKVHHCLIDNFNDDGIDFGERKRGSRYEITQNVISRILQSLTLHRDERTAGPLVEVEKGDGAYIGRNIIDQRKPVYSRLPASADAPQEMTTYGRVCIDHGTPTWPDYYVYQNTIVIHDPAPREQYGAGMVMGTRGSQHRLMNNIFISTNDLPGMAFLAGENELVADYNLQWSLAKGATYQGDFLAEMRKTKNPRAFQWFELSKKQYPDGWTSHDVFGDPKLKAASADPNEPLNATLQQGSPAIDKGTSLPGDWPDPVRTADHGVPDMGAVPFGVEAWGVGSHGRFSAACEGAAKP